MTIDHARYKPFKDNGNITVGANKATNKEIIIVKGKESTVEDVELKPVEITTKRFDPMSGAELDPDVNETNLTQIRFSRERVSDAIQNTQKHLDELNEKLAGIDENISDVEGLLS